jgi:hypothetical protein
MKIWSYGPLIFDVLQLYLETDESTESGSAKSTSAKSESVFAESESMPTEDLSAGSVECGVSWLRCHLGSFFLSSDNRFIIGTSSNTRHICLLRCCHHICVLNCDSAEM